MPQIWNNKLVVTGAELVPMWINTSSALKLNIHRNKDNDYGIKKVCSGGNGRQLLISFDSLPKEIQNGLGDPRKNDHLLELFYETDKAAVQFFTTYEFEDGASLSLAHQEEYITNASVLRACIELKSQRVKTIVSMGGSPKKVMSSILADAMSFNKTLEVKHKVSHTLPASDKRFKQAFNEFSKPYKDWKFNYPSLISGKLRNQNSRKVVDNVMQLLNDLFAGRSIKPSRTQVSREYDGFLQGYIEVINPETGEVYNPKDFKPLSDATIINYLGSWNEAIGTEAKRSNSRLKLIGKFRTPHKLKRPEWAGIMLSVDDRQPPFEYAPGQRVWFYNGIDLGSEALTCWVYGKSKEGIIMEFYRQLVRNYTEWGFNLPLELEAEASLNSGFTNTFLQEGRMFNRVRIEANNPRGKRIERYFGELRYENEKQREGWIPRPHARDERNQGNLEKKQIIPYQDIIAQCLRDIEDWNNCRHAVHTDKTRWQVFEEMQYANSKPTNWRAILPYLGYSTKTSCGFNGVIQLNNTSFLLGDEGKPAKGQRLIDLMEQVAGEPITCFWLDGNDNEVLKALVYHNDRIICEAVAHPTYSRSYEERTPEGEAARTAMSAYVATIDAYMKDRRNSINEVILIDNTPKPERRFSISNAKRYEAIERPAEVLGEMPDENTFDTTTILNANLSAGRTTKDRL